MDEARAEVPNFKKFLYANRKLNDACVPFVQTEFMQTLVLKYISPGRRIEYREDTLSSPWIHAVKIHILAWDDEMHWYDESHALATDKEIYVTGKLSVRAGFEATKCDYQDISKTSTCPTAY